MSCGCGKGGGCHSGGPRSVVASSPTDTTERVPPRDADAALDLLNRLKSNSGAAAVPAKSWWLRTFRITRIRVVSQFFFFAIFMFFCFTTWFSRLKGYPVSLILEIDPLVAVATAISTHTVYRHLIWSLWLIIPTLILGRVFCNWMCPYRTLH